MPRGLGSKAARPNGRPAIHEKKPPRPAKPSVTSIFLSPRCSGDAFAKRARQIAQGFNPLVIEAGVRAKMKTPELIDIPAFQSSRNRGRCSGIHETDSKRLRHHSFNPLVIEAGVRAKPVESVDSATPEVFQSSRNRGRCSGDGMPDSVEHDGKVSILS